ncbi:MAG: DUF4276 family protein [Verrucomicrobiales bacterium]
MNPKRLVVFVEGEGDSESSIILLNKVLTDQEAWDCAFADSNVFTMKGGVEKCLGKGADKFRNWIRAAALRPNLGGILVLIDGDKPDPADGCECPFEIASRIGAEAAKAGAGSSFSLAVVLARQEFESWFVAAAGHLAGKDLPDGRPGLAKDASSPPDPETEPRDAKGWLGRQMRFGYKPTRDQAQFAKMIDDLQILRDKGLRSFTRFESVHLAARFRNSKRKPFGVADELITLIGDCWSLSLLARL